MKSPDFWDGKPLLKATKTVVACAIAKGDNRVVFENAQMYIKFEASALSELGSIGRLNYNLFNGIKDGNYNVGRWLSLDGPESTELPSLSKMRWRWNIPTDPGAYVFDVFTVNKWTPVLRVKVNGDPQENWKQYNEGSKVDATSLGAFKEDGHLSAFPCVAWKILSDAMGAFVGDECNARSREGQMIVDSLNRLADRVRQQVNVRLLRARCIPEDADADKLSAAGKGKGAAPVSPAAEKLIDILDDTPATTFCVLGVIDRQPQQEMRRPQYIDLYDLQRSILLWNEDDQDGRKKIVAKLTELQDRVNNDIDNKAVNNDIDNKAVQSIYRFRGSLGRLDFKIKEDEDGLTDFRQDALRLLSAVVMHNRNSSLGVLELMDSLVNGTSVICRRDDENVKTEIGERFN
jgi:hypothetical protein